MSKLGTILQPRTLPTAPESSVLFANCNPAMPDMFKILLKSWQNSGIHSVVDDQAINDQSLSFTTHSTQAETAFDQEQAQAANDGTVCDPAPTDEMDCQWITRLADEWQVGTEALVPLTWQTARPIAKPTRINPGAELSRMSPAVIELQTGVSSIDKAECMRSTAGNPTEYFADKLAQAFQTGAASTVQQVLQLINRHPQTSVGALIVLKETLVKNASTPTSMDWETGMDSNGKSFMRLNIKIMNDSSKGAGSTKLTIGSDGTTYATFTERWNSEPLYMAPDEALSMLQGNRKRLRDFNKASRQHFKAAGF